MGLVYIGLGGALGALSRYGLSGVIVRWSSGGGFPYATLAVNLLGCLLIGIVWGLSERFTFHDHLGLFLLSGFLAAFTTFSTFCYENVILVRAQEWKILLMNICLSNLVGIALVGFGFCMVHELLKAAR